MPPEFDLKAFRASLAAFRDRTELPSEQEILDIADRATCALENESRRYRPAGHRKTPGGLLDFSSLSQDVILVPDLHARHDFLLKLLDSDIVTPDVLTAVAEKRCTVVCVGDGWHTETLGKCADRWRFAFAEWQFGCIDSEDMRDEIHDCLATILPVMMLKTAFPENFHFLKGNHENILNENAHGNHAFRKYASEGQMVLEFMEKVYSQATVHMLNEYESALPIVAQFRNFAVSHAEPECAFSRREIIDYRRNDSVIYNFTWTDNGEAEEDSVRRQALLLDGNADAESFLWFGGHRPVRGKYALRQEGRYVQFHNPGQMNVVHVHADGSFDLEKDIVSVEGK